MPDMERLTREFHIHLVDMYEGGEKKNEIVAYYKGVDAARKEIVVVALIVAVLCVVVSLFIL